MNLNNNIENNKESISPEQEVINKLHDMWAFLDHKNLTVKLNDNLVFIDWNNDWNIDLITKNNDSLESIINIYQFKKDYSYKNFLSLVWLEEREENWISNIYDVSTWKERLIIQTSREYLEKFEEIRFIESYIGFNSFISELDKSIWDFWDKSEQTINILLNWKYWRLKDLIKIKKYIDDELFEEYKPKFIELLFEQINMKAFSYVNDEVTEEEIKMYFDKWFIDKETTIRLYNLIIERDELNNKKEEKKKDIILETHSSLNKYNKEEFNV